MIERRDAARAGKEAQKDTGKSEIDAFHTERTARIAAIKKKNREDEKNMAAEMASTMEFGSQWEKVCCRGEAR